VRRAKPVAPKTPVLPPELQELATEKLREDYFGFISDTATEDPKHFIGRIAAADAAYGHLAILRDAQDAAAPDADPSTDDVLAEARTGIAHENKT